MYWFLVYFLLLIPYRGEGEKPCPSPKEIVWTRGYELKWNDFEGKPERGKHPVALTSSSIYFGYTASTRQFDIVVYASFFKDESWVRPGKESDYLLKHEQGHFDLTEIYARKLRQEVLKYQNRGKAFEKDYDKLFDRCFNDLKKVQGQYDRETEHSIDRKAQAKWNIQIEQWLEQTSGFQDQNILLFR